MTPGYRATVTLYGATQIAHVNVVTRRGDLVASEGFHTPAAVVTFLNRYGLRPEDAITTFVGDPDD